MYVPYRPNGKRDSKRRYVDTNTGEVVSRYQQLKSSYGGITPEQHAKVRSGEYTEEGIRSERYRKAFRQFQKHNPGLGEDSEEWQSTSDNLFSHYPGSLGNARSKEIWERRIEAINELWYDQGDSLDDDTFGDYISPKQGE